MINGEATSTAASRLIDAHYETANVRSIWDKKRVERLAKSFNFTIYELASLCGIEHKEFVRSMHANNLRMPVCILLTLLENTFLSKVFPDTIDLFDFSNDGSETIEEEGMHGAETQGGVHEQRGGSRLGSQEEA